METVKQQLVRVETDHATIMADIQTLKQGLLDEKLMCRMSDVVFLYETTVVLSYLKQAGLVNKEYMTIRHVYNDIHMQRRQHKSTRAITDAIASVYLRHGFTQSEVTTIQTCCPVLYYVEDNDTHIYFFTPKTLQDIKHRLQDMSSPELKSCFIKLCDVVHDDLAKYSDAENQEELVY